MNKTKLAFGLLFLFLFDRLTKSLALNLPEEGLFYSPFLALKTYLNSGIAFSFKLPAWLILGLGILISLLLIYFWLKDFLKERSKNLWPLGLVIIGSVSNLLDRFYQEGVIDFINIYVLPSFNLADLYIFVGLIYLLVLINQKEKSLPKEIK